MRREGGKESAASEQPRLCWLIDGWARRNVTLRGYFFGDGSHTKFIVGFRRIFGYT